ncbi:MAG: serine protein kinase RIO [Candidatus Diapherotrites archaeon]|nr:serine protein kinase RIO [Candidatus Diapherotrites archaeon]
MSTKARIEDYIKDEKLRNTFSQVFDYTTVAAIHELAAKGFIDHLEHIISTGKEAHVYLAFDKAGKKRAVKIYKIETSNFRNLRKYIEGDPRFKNISSDRRDIICLWARKEYKNLEKLADAGVRVPLPYAFNQNVLVMEFIGNDAAAMPLKEDPITDFDFLYEFIIKEVAKMIYHAKLVHGDLSEYNILNFEGKPVIIDCGQAVTTAHPHAMEFFQRDIKNISSYLAKNGLKKSLEEIKQDIKKAR